jgi:pimeloyl-ACP methyl ester carboxylesterase
VPALLIWGKDDQFAVEAMAKESLRYCDDGHVEIFENASHWVQHEHPEKLNKLLLKFFA